MLGGKISFIFSTDYKPFYLITSNFLGMSYLLKNTHPIFLSSPLYLRSSFSLATFTHTEAITFAPWLTKGKSLGHTLWKKKILNKKKPYYLLEALGLFTSLGGERKWQEKGNEKIENQVLSPDLAKVLKFGTSTKGLAKFWLHEVGMRKFQLYYQMWAHISLVGFCDPWVVEW